MEDVSNLLQWPFAVSKNGVRVGDLRERCAWSRWGCSTSLSIGRGGGGIENKQVKTKQGRGERRARSSREPKVASCDIDIDCAFVPSNPSLQSPPPRSVLLRDLYNQPGQSLLRWLSSKWLAVSNSSEGASDCEAGVVWLGCTGRDAKSVCDGFDAANCAGGGFLGSGSSLYLDLASQQCSTLLLADNGNGNGNGNGNDNNNGNDNDNDNDNESCSTDGPCGDSLLKSAYSTAMKFVSDLESKGCPSLIVLDDFSALCAMFGHRDSLDLAHYLCNATHTHTASLLTLCGNDAAALPVPSAGDYDSKWLGSGGTFGLSSDEVSASVRVLNDEEGSADPTGSRGDFSALAKGGKKRHR